MARANGAIGLHPADGHGHVVNHAEAFAMPRKGMMKSAADIHPKPIPHRMLRRQNRTAGRQPEPFDGLLRARDFQPHPFGRAQRVVLELIDIFRRVHAQDVFIAGRFGSDDVGRIGNAFGDQPVADQAELLGGKNVRASRRS